MLNKLTQRNHARYRVSLIVALVALTSSAFGQVTPLGGKTWSSNGPDGGAIDWFVVATNNPNTIYAGRPGGVFKSPDGGATWASANSEMPNTNVSELALDPIHPGTMYVLGNGRFNSNANASTDYGNGSLYKSTNGGGSWTAINNGLPQNINGLYLNNLILDPLTPTTLYVRDNGGIYKSIDGGANWNLLTIKIGPVGSALAIDLGNPNTLYVDGTFKSTDGGVTWNKSNPGIILENDQVIVLAVARNDSNLIYAGTYQGYILTSTDGGANWSKFNLNANFPFKFIFNWATVGTLIVDPINPNIAYAGTAGGGVFKTTNRGASWAQFNTGLGNTIVYGLAIDSSNGNNIYAGTDGSGAFRSTNGGASWNALSIAHRNVAVRALAIDPGNPGSVYAARASVFKSNDGGASWNANDPPITNAVFNFLVIDPSNANIVYALIDDYVDSWLLKRTGGSVFKSTNGGASWSAAQNGLAGVYVNTLVIDPGDHSILYAASMNGLFKSTDAGANWKTVPGGVADIFDLEIAASNPEIMYAAAYGGDYDTLVLKSEDGGASWDRFDIGLPPDPVSSLALDPNDPNIIYAALPGCVYKSTDGAASWEQAGLTSPQWVSVLLIDPDDTNTLYAGVYLGGVFKSADGGATWSAFNDGLINLNVHTLALDPAGKYLHAGTDAGVFDIQLSASPQPNPIDDAEFFIRLQYMDFLGREPEPQGLQFYLDILNGCQPSDTECIKYTRGAISANFFRSPEFQRKGSFVMYLYMVSLGQRPVTPAELNDQTKIDRPHYAEFIADLQSISDPTDDPAIGEAKKVALTDAWMQRTEMQNRYGGLSNAAFVQKLLDTAGVTLANQSALVDDLNAARKTRAQVLRAIAESPDVNNKFYKQAFVTMEYFGYLHRDPETCVGSPDPANCGYIFHNSRFQLAADPDFLENTIVRGFIESPEYRQRFGQP